MRASSRRSHHSTSSCFVRETAAQDEALELQLLRVRFALQSSGMPICRAMRAAVVGPLISSRPRTSCCRASSSDTSRCKRFGQRRRRRRIRQAAAPRPPRAIVRRRSTVPGRRRLRAAPPCPARPARRKILATRRPSASASAPTESNVSCSSSASRTSGQASAAHLRDRGRDRARPDRARRRARTSRRAATARVRRSSSGASSRNAYGLALSSWWLNGDGSRVSRPTNSIRPASTSAQHFQPAVEVHRLVQAVVHRLPHERMIGRFEVAVRCSKQAVCCGNTAVSKSSARNRCKCGGTFLPPRCRSTASARVTFHRQRTWNIGTASSA